MMASLDSAAVIRVMADATNTIAAGEVMQLMNSGDPDTTEVRYMEVIYRKTARLFEAGAQIAGIIAGATAPTQAALAGYGKHLGIAFQLIDDALD
jgi:octaprenyl-diphosphate synthase